MKRLAILAGQGALPQMIAAQHPSALFVHFEGIAVDLPDIEVLVASYERFGELFDGLNAANVTDVVFAGGLARPALDPANFDAKMMELAPRFMAAMQGGDDELLRTVIATFDEHGFTVKGAHDVLPELTIDAGCLTQSEPGNAETADAQKAWRILQALSPLDVSQACVVANGACLGIETAQGTEAMLGFVAHSRGKLRAALRGVLVKFSKTGQDLRVDMPAIGPDTVDQAVTAGLAGICIEAHRVLILDRDEVIRRANTAGLAIWAETCFPSS